jgi:phosphoglycolate phosphatase
MVAPDAGYRRAQPQPAIDGCSCRDFDEYGWVHLAASRVSCFPVVTVIATALKPQAALIDLDGTLMDTVPDLAEAANRMRVDCGLPRLPPARLAQFVGKGAEVLVHRALLDAFDGEAPPARFASARTAFYRHYHDTNGALAVVFDGVPAALRALRALGLKLACVTNKPREFTLPLLERARLAPWFDAVVAGDDVKEKKPHPALLYAACRRLQVAPAAALMIGDSRNDALAAHAAGCATALVETGYNEGEPLDSLADSPGVFAIVPTLLDAAATIKKRFFI